MRAAEDVECVMPLSAADIVIPPPVDETPVERPGRTTRRPPKFDPIAPPEPLHQAAYLGNVDELKQILASGTARLEKPAKRGWTPLHFTARYGNAECASVLLAAGASTAAKDIKGSTPLHRAAFSGSIEVMELLLDAGADIEAKDHLGQTPLHTAASSGQIFVIDFLLDRGASQQARDGPLCDGNKPWDVAMVADEVDCAKLLRARQLRRVGSAGGASYLVPRGHPRIPESYRW